MLHASMHMLSSPYAGLRVTHEDPDGHSVLVVQRSVQIEEGRWLDRSHWQRFAERVTAPVRRLF